MHPVTLEALTSLIRKQEDEIRDLRRRRRALILMLLEDGRPIPEIAKAAGVKGSLVERHERKTS